MFDLHSTFNGWSIGLSFVKIVSAFAIMYIAYVLLTDDDDDDDSGHGVSELCRN